LRNRHQTVRDEVSSDLKASFFVSPSWKLIESTIEIYIQQTLAVLSPSSLQSVFAVIALGDISLLLL
jgi:hypothetical protein